jgi:monothiol glutaredoxin
MSTDAILTRIQQQIADNQVILYMKGTPDFPQCGFSSRAVNILKECGANFATVNILEEPEIRQVLPQYANWPTFPQLYIQGELIGGSDIMLELFESGELQQMLV